MSIDKDQNLTTDSVNSLPQSTLNNLNKPSKFDCHSLSPSITNVTIESLSDGDSSIIDSDSDLDELPKTAADFFRSKVVCSASGSDEQNEGVIVINETNSSDKNNVIKQPQIGSIAVQNSSDITFGNKTFYQGPVTIKQFLLEKNQWRSTESGVDNKGFQGSHRDVSADNGKLMVISKGILKKTNHVKALRMLRPRSNAFLRLNRKGLNDCRKY